MSKADLEPLAWSERIRGMGRWERFFFVGALWGCPYRRELREMGEWVRRRGDVMDQWPADARLRETLAVVKRALVEEMDWPAANFVPADRCEVLFRSRHSDALDAHDAIFVMSRDLGIPKSFCYDLVAWTLGELVERLNEVRTK